MWARIIRNKTVIAVRPKVDNIWQVGPSFYTMPSGMGENYEGLSKINFRNNNHRTK